jgi:hypothetical protein
MYNCMNINLILFYSVGFDEDSSVRSNGSNISLTTPLEVLLPLSLPASVDILCDLMMM